MEDERSPGGDGGAGHRDPAEWAPLLDSVLADLSRVADRLRSLSESRLAGAVPGYSSRAAAGRAVAQAAAVAAQGVEEAGSAAEPSWRTVPELSDLAVGDQLAVTGHDLVAAARAVSPGDEVWRPGSRLPALAVVTDVGVRLAELRRLL